jgi:osmotically-inducible protein OsmY
MHIKMVFAVVLLVTFYTTAGASPQHSKRDAAIARSVRQVLASKPEYTKVNFEVDDAIVNLKGEMRLLSERDALVRSVRRIQHVSRVENGIVLLPANVSDERLSSAVKERLESAGFGYLRFQAHEGWVQVEGNVKTQQDAARLADTVRTIAGVKEADFQKVHVVSSNKN